MGSPHANPLREPGDIGHAAVSRLPFRSWCTSVALYAEWHDTLTRTERAIPGTSPEMTLGFPRHIASQSHLQEIYFLGCPFLSNADDDMILGLAIAVRCRIIVPHNIRDFAGEDPFGIDSMSSGDSLRRNLIGLTERRDVLEPKHDQL